LQRNISKKPAATAATLGLSMRPKNILFRKERHEWTSTMSKMMFRLGMAPPGGGSTHINSLVCDFRNKMSRSLPPFQT
jgi:hypothetical protein